MRVLYVIDSLARGGAERSLASMAPHLAEGGVDLTVACLHRRPDLADEVRAAGGTVLYLPSSPRWRWPAAVVAIARDRRPDLVHTTLYDADQVGRLAGWRLGVPVVSSLVNTPYGPEHLGDPRLRPWKVRTGQALDIASSRLVTRFHAVSHHVRTVMAPRLRIAPSRIDVVPRGRDPLVLGRRTTERRARARAELGIPHDAPVVLAVGRQEHQKGFDLLLRATGWLARTEPGLVVLIAGRTGAASERLQRLVRDLGVDRSVRFLGERDDIGDLLCATDVFAFPSRWEGMPGAVIEAMGLEAPIVASDIPQVREVVGTSMARLTPPEDPAGLASAIAECLEPSPARQARVAAAHHRFTTTFTTAATSRAMVELYHRVVAEAPRGRARPDLHRAGGARTDGPGHPPADWRCRTSDPASRAAESTSTRPSPSTSAAATP